MVWKCIVGMLPCALILCCLTRSAGLVDFGQELQAAVISPVMQYPGQDVEVSFRQLVLKKVPCNNT